MPKLVVKKVLRKVFVPKEKEKKSIGEKRKISAPLEAITPPPGPLPLLDMNSYRQESQQIGGLVVSPTSSAPQGPQQAGGSIIPPEPFVPGYDRGRRPSFEAFPDDYKYFKSLNPDYIDYSQPPPCQQGLAPPPRPERPHDFELKFQMKVCYAVQEISYSPTCANRAQVVTTEGYYETVEEANERAEEILANYFKFLEKGEEKSDTDFFKNGTDKDYGGNWWHVKLQDGTEVKAVVHQLV